MNQSVFTYAVGSKYLKLAYTLARSYCFHNDIEKVPFYIISSENFNLPYDLYWVNKSIVNIDLVGQGLEFKLRLNELAPTKESIFIDSDSVIYGNIKHLFDKLLNQSFGVIGTNVTSGRWADEDIESCCKEFNLDRMIRYCGALYLIKKDEITDKVFSNAMALHLSKRKFQKHRHNINEEPLIAISICQLNIAPIIDDGNIWCDLVNLKPNQKISVFKPITLVNNKNYNYKFWLPEGNYSPKIIHIGSNLLNKSPWLFEFIRLKAFYNYNLPILFIEFTLKFIIIPQYKMLKIVNKCIKSLCKLGKRQ